MIRGRCWLTTLKKKKARLTRILFVDWFKHKLDSISRTSLPLSIHYLIEVSEFIDCPVGIEHWIEKNLRLPIIASILSQKPEDTVQKVTCKAIVFQTKFV
jgi:hypothetical protein